MFQQETVARLLAEEQVELDIPLIEGPHVVAIRSRAHVSDCLFHFAQVRLFLSHQTGCQTLQDRTDLANMDDILIAQLSDPGTAIGSRLNETFRSKRI